MEACDIPETFLNGDVCVEAHDSAGQMFPESLKACRSFPQPSCHWVEELPCKLPISSLKEGEGQLLIWLGRNSEKKERLTCKLGYLLFSFGPCTELGHWFTSPAAH